MAHTKARKIIRRGNPDAQVGANPLLLGLPIWLQRLLNENATRIRSYRDLHKRHRHCVEPRQFERGVVDVVIAALTRTPERERQVMFSQDYLGQVPETPKSTVRALSFIVSGPELVKDAS